MKKLTYLTIIATVVSLSFTGFSSFKSTSAKAGVDVNSIVFVYGVSPGHNGQETVWFPTEDKAIKYAKDLAYADGKNNAKEGLYTLKRAMVSDLKLQSMKHEGIYVEY